jgi:hypothetical protein
MTAARQSLGDYIPLLDFLAKEIDKDEAWSIAELIGVKSSVRTPERTDARMLWQAVLEAMLSAKRIDSFLREVDKRVGDGDRESFEQAKRACAKAQFEAILRRDNGDLGSASGQLASARTLGELANAATACRELVLKILSSVEVGSPHRSLTLIASNSADIDRQAERIGTLAMNVLTIIERLLDLTDPGGSPGPRTLTVEQLDDLGTFGEVVPDDAKLLTQARNARAIVWTQLQRLLAELNRNAAL